MKTSVLTVTTGTREVVHDLTGECRRFVRGRGDGLLHVFVPHATAGVAVLELGAGSDDDLLAALQDLLPADDRWRHRHGSRGHGRSHVLPAIVPPGMSWMSRTEAVAPVPTVIRLDDSCDAALKAHVVAYLRVSLDTVMLTEPERIRDLLTEVSEGLAAAVWTPLPAEIYPLTEARAAFRRMQQARHIGKIVLDLTS